ncbi:MAG: hypothetical protein O3A51_11545, partial [Verrucomicrobia bacterium]|nr:hypothetical protein [Verrucomicrobiota bacterium]
ELDYGGIYIDHFLPNASWIQMKDEIAVFAEAIVSAHATDSRIIAWDLCNEPFAYNCPPQDIPHIMAAEYAWLARLYDIVKRCGAQAPVTVGIHPDHGVEGLRQIEPISDILSIHAYWKAINPPEDKVAFESVLDGYAEFAASVNKPLIASETCWGSLDDAKRVEIVRYTLANLKKRGISWLAYVLHHTLSADAHRPEYGPLGAPGNLAFIEADGSLRPGHDVFNEF